MWARSLNWKTDLHGGVPPVHEYGLDRTARHCIDVGVVVSLGRERLDVICVDTALDD